MKTDPEIRIEGHAGQGLDVILPQSGMLSAEIMRDISLLGLSFVVITVDGITRLDPETVLIEPSKDDESHRPT